MKNYENKAVLAKNIQRYLNRMGMNKKDLSVALNLPYMTVSNWLLGKSYPRIDKIEMMANFFGCQKTDLIEDKEAIKPVKLTPNRVPLIGQIACGTPILAEQNIEDYFTLPSKIKADFCLTCKGDSMVEAGINDGDTVFFTAQPTVENGEIAAVVINGEATLKKVCYLNAENIHDGIILFPANAQYKPIIVNDDVNQVYVAGKMVAILKVVNQ